MIDFMQVGWLVVAFMAGVIGGLWLAIGLHAAAGWAEWRLRRRHGQGGA